MGDELKRDHEVAIATCFAAFLRTEGRLLGDPLPGDIRRREPDAVCASPDVPVGIEVASGYYSDVEATNVWSVARGRPEKSTRHVGPGDDPRAVLARAGVLVNPDESLAVSLRRTMLDHCGKTCSVPSYLVLDASTAAITTAEDGPGMASDLRPPDDCRFLGVYLALRGNFSPELVFLRL